MLVCLQCQIILYTLFCNFGIVTKFTLTHFEKFYKMSFKVYDCIFIKKSYLEDNVIEGMVYSTLN